MKTGTYDVTFSVNLNDCEDEHEAREAIKGMLEEMLANDELPELNFVLTQELDLEYSIEENEIPELNFEEAV
jgi:hypothetical protein